MSQAEWAAFLEELSSIWNAQFSRYVNFGMPSVDLRLPLAAALIGIGVVVGADMLIRRKADDVIKRLRSKDKDTGRHKH